MAAAPLRSVMNSRRLIMGDSSPARAVNAQLAGTKKPAYSPESRSFPPIASRALILRGGAV